MPATTRTAHDGWWRTAPVLTIAVLALIISTAGGAYAVGKNSIGTKQLKNNAVTSGKIRSSTIQSSDIKSDTVTSSDVRNGSLTAGDFAPGVLPPAPEPPPSRTYFARVAVSGTLQAKSSGVVSSSQPYYGYYLVQLGFDPAACALMVTPFASTDSVATADLGSGLPNTVRVLMKDSTVTPVQRAFSLSVIC
jgi:hypothetical protein